MQIELGNGYAITLTASDDGSPDVTLWVGSGECDLKDQDQGSFIDWVEETRNPIGVLKRH